MRFIGTVFQRLRSFVGTSSIVSQQCPKGSLPEFSDKQKLNWQRSRLAGAIE